MRRVCLVLWYRALAAGAAILFGSTALFATPEPTTASPAATTAAAAAPEADALVTELATCLSGDDHEVVFFPDKKFECVKFQHRRPTSPRHHAASSATRP